MNFVKIAQIVKLCTGYCGIVEGIFANFSSGTSFSAKFMKNGNNFCFNSYIWNSTESLLTYWGCAFSIMKLSSFFNLYFSIAVSFIGERKGTQSKQPIFRQYILQTSYISKDCATCHIFQKYNATWTLFVIHLNSLAIYFKFHFTRTETLKHKVSAYKVWSIYVFILLK